MREDMMDIEMIELETFGPRRIPMLPLGLFRAFLRINEIDYGLLTALAFIYLLPAVVAFGFARRFLVQTFSGGVKG